MLGVYDFNGHYDWTFAWLDARGGDEALRDYWVNAISRDSQAHARKEFARGFPGMSDYWGHTLAEEGAGYTSGQTESWSGKPVFRLDMQECPSKGFLLRNGLDAGTDYCDHCIGWVGPAMADAGFVVDHEHDHAAHCWWEIRPIDDQAPPSAAGELGPEDVRLRYDWAAGRVDRFGRTMDPRDND